mgnify:FL=1
MDNQSAFRPSPKYQMHIVIWVILSFALFVLPFIFLALIPELGLVYLLVFLIGNALWIIPTLLLVPAYCRSIEYQFGDENLLVRRGIVTRSESMVPYRMITNVEVKRGPIARALGIGTLKVHTAGYSQQSQAEASLAGLANWAEVREQLLARIHEHQSEGGGRPQGAGAAVEADVSTLLADILAELRQMRRG